MKKYSIASLKQMIQDGTMTDEIIDTLKEDKRKGVQQIMKQYENRKADFLLKREQFYEMKQFDACFIHDDVQWIAGVDEAGRGPLAGPVVAASVILKNDVELIGLTDSKQLTEKERNEFFTLIKKEALAYQIEVVSAEKIDKINILEATKLAMRQSLLNLSVTPDFALIDAVKLTGLPFPSEAVIKGDDKSIAIAAASILAKVTRDKLMEEFDVQYPQYGFHKHKGYGTKSHLEAMKEHGVTPIHRTSFRPVRDVLYHMEADF